MAPTTVPTIPKKATTMALAIPAISAVPRLEDRLEVGGGVNGGGSDRGGGSGGGDKGGCGWHGGGDNGED